MNSLKWVLQPEFFVIQKNYKYFFKITKTARNQNHKVYTEKNIPTNMFQPAQLSLLLLY